MKDIKDFENRIICGDCLEIMGDLPDESIDIIITSPPYWNAKNYESTTSRSKMPKKYSLEQYQKEMTDIFFQAYRTLKKGRYCCIVIDGVTVEKRYYNLPMIFQTFMEEMGFVYHIPLYWLKPLGSQGMWKSGATWSLRCLKPLTYYPNQRLEHIMLFRKKEPKECEGQTDLKYGELKDWLDNVWVIKTASTELHKCPFPVEIPMRLIKLLSFVGDAVLDPFNGIGTTAVACRESNRRYIGIEINPDYCKVAEQRLANIPKMRFDSIDDASHPTPPQGVADARGMTEDDG